MVFQIVKKAASVACANHNAEHDIIKSTITRQPKQYTVNIYTKDMKRILFLSIMAWTVAQVLAAPVDPTAATAVAQQFVNSQSSQGPHRAPAQAQVMLVHTELGTANQPVYYIFNSEDGFVIIAGDDRAREVLAHGDQPLDINRIPDNMRFWLSGYREQLDYLLSHPDLKVEKNIRRAPSRKAEDIPPLITALWDQSEPYYNECPTYNSQRCLTGCAATSLSMVFYYWKYPTEPTPTVAAYTTSSLRMRLEQLPSTTFDWDNMIDSYARNYSSQQASAVAHLMRYIGQAEKMDYAPDGSGSYANNVLQAVKLFGYDQSATVVNKTSNWWSNTELYSDEEWAEIILNELAASRPMVMCAYSQDPGGLSGHAFNIDGYDASEDTYHINWGWSGSGNAYYALNAFGYAGSTFNIQQQLVIGIEPAATQPTIRPGLTSMHFQAYEDSTRVKTLRIRGTLLTSGVTLTLNDNNGVFQIDTHSISLSELSNGKNVKVTYSPKAAGSHTATITLSSAGADVKTVTLNGTCDLEVYAPYSFEVSQKGEFDYQAQWKDNTPQHNVASYQLEVAPTPYYDLRMAETFDVTEYDGISNTDNASQLDEFTHNPGWTGSKVYRSGSSVILGTTKSKGWLETPAMDMLYNEGHVTVIVSAKTVGSDTSSPLIISCGNNNTSITVTDADTEYRVMLPCTAATDAKVRLATVTGKRVTVNSMSVYAGDCFSPVDTSKATYINDITGTSVEMKDMSPGYYSLRVHCIYRDGSESPWTERVPLIVNWRSADVNHDNEISIADINQLLDVVLNGYLVPSAVKVNDVNHDGEVNLADINSIIDTILEQE